ncbi:S-adenosyl-L-methionine-dependent methyltransferase [Cubamyces sp. BRFM 1775]|nr:S-adenosyl-L-methionine-dependent methyltransferase [Cubamyces sp. BRFM 1775]
MASAAASLLARLSRAIGRESAQHELRWMRQALQAPSNRIPPSAQTVEDMVERRIRGEPLQYILGSQPFGPLNLAVRSPVLIPRPETEDWALNLAELIRSQPAPARPLNILDLCTGTGCIPLLLCRELPPGTAHATGVDISEDAVTLAKENARLNDVPVLPPPYSRHASSRERRANTFTPVLADLMQPGFVKNACLDPPYDVITSNPPYIPKAEYDRLDASVKDYEDVRALLGDPEGAVPVTLPEAEREKGLSFYHRIAELLRDEDLLEPNGILALEVGDGQADDVASILKRRTHMQTIDIWNDPWGKARVVFARR